MADFRKLAAIPPRVGILADRFQTDVPVGREAIPAKESNRRADELTREVVAGRIPLDETSGPIVAKAMQFRRRRSRQKRKEP